MPAILAQNKKYPGSDACTHIKVNSRNVFTGIPAVTAGSLLCGSYICIPPQTLIT